MPATLRSFKLAMAMSSIQGHDQHVATLRASQDQHRRRLLAEVRRLIDAGERPGDPALAHATLFSDGSNPEGLASYAEKLRALNDRLVGHTGELLLLARMVDDHSSKTGQARAEFEMAYSLPFRELMLATLSGDGLRYGFRHQHDIALPTIQVVSESDIERAHTGRFRPPVNELEELIFRDPERDGITVMAVGWEAICEYSFKSKGVYIPAITEMAKTLGIALPDPTG